MKRFIILVGILIIFSACKKEYVCVCTSITYDATGNMVGTTAINAGIARLNKGKAKQWCDDEKIGTWINGGYVTQTTCELKK